MDLIGPNKDFRLKKQNRKTPENYIEGHRISKKKIKIRATLTISVITPNNK